MLDFSRNYFELFDLPIGLAVDDRRLAERYLTLQAAAHPDRFSVAAGEEPPSSRKAASQVENAYRTLKDPVARARYLLELSDPDPLAAGEGSCDGAFYLEQIELRESLAEARASSNPRAAMARILTQIVERSAALDKELDTLLAEPSEDNLASAQQTLQRLQFLDACRRDLESLATDT